MEVYGYTRPRVVKKRKQKFVRSRRWAYHNHTKLRMEERYGIIINARDHDRLVWKIQQGQFKELCRFTNSRICYEIPYEGKKIIAVYSNTNHRLVTVLPNRMKIETLIFLHNAL